MQNLSRWGKGFGLIKQLAGEDFVLNQPNGVYGVISYPLFILTSKKLNIFSQKLYFRSGKLVTKCNWFLQVGSRVYSWQRLHWRSVLQEFSYHYILATFSSTFLVTFVWSVYPFIPLTLSSLSYLHFITTTCLASSISWNELPHLRKSKWRNMFKSHLSTRSSYYINLHRYITL